jgi:MFS family permease
MAIGLLGMGSGIGFFAGPQFAGWRAQAATWHFDSVADWQRPLVEAGLAGAVIGVLFLLIAREVRPKLSIPTPHVLGGTLARKVARMASVLMCRDFAGLATLSLASIYLQKAHHLDAKHTGIIIGSTMLLSIVVSPVSVYLSAGKRRLPTLVLILIGGGLAVAVTPLFPVSYVLPVLMTFMTFQLGSYAVSDAAMLERVPPDIRGRVVGIFLLIAGTFSSTAPYVMGWATDRLGERATNPSAYLPIFIVLGAMMILAIGAVPLIHTLGEVQGPPIEPLSETTPRTVEPGL